MTTSQLLSSLGSNVHGVPFIDIRSQLPVNLHYTWSQLAGVRPESALNTAVCHHDAIPKHKSIQHNDIVFASRIATDHINSKKNHPNGDAGFPYDLWIRNGNLYWCNDIEQREYGVAGNNGYTVNVCVSGDYHNYDTLTPEDRRALYVAIIILKGVLPALKNIKGHNQITATSCPGYNMDQVREDVMTLEMEIQQAESEPKKEEVAYRMANHILYLQRMSKGLKPDSSAATEGESKWALSQLLKLQPEFKRLGFLK